MSQKDGQLEVSWARSGLRFLCQAYHRLHSDLTRNYNLLVRDPHSVPEWLSQGITTLIPKNDKTDQAKQAYHVSYCVL